MARGGASEIKPEHVIAAITDRSQKIELLDAQLAGAYPITEQRLARLREHKAAISAEISELTTVLEGVRRGDLAFTEEIQQGRMDELLAARTDQIPRLRGVPLKERLEIESANRASMLAFDMTMPASSAHSVMAAPDATPSDAAGGQMDAAMAEVNQDAAAPAPVQSSAAEGLARLQI